MTDRGGAAHPLVELTLARFREFLREPEAVFWVFAFPVIMTCALGIAFRSRGAEPVIVGVVEQAGADAVRRTLDDAGGFAVRLVSPDGSTAPSATAGRRWSSCPGRRPPTGSTSRAPRAGGPAGGGSRAAARRRTAGRLHRRRAADRRRRHRYIDWLVPGLLGMNIASTGLWGVGFSIVQARTKKLLKRLVATPMSRSAYLASHVLSRLLFLALETTVIVGFAWAAFGVQVRGGVAALAVLAITGALSFGGLGLLVACRARTIEAVSGLMNLVMMPMWVLSGVFFASSNFPDVMQPFIQALPLTALNDALRGVMNEGLSLVALGDEIAILVAWGLGTFALALRLFRWQ